MTKDEIKEAIKKMNVLELSELVKELEKVHPNFRAAAELVPLLDTQILVDAAGYCAGTVDLLACGGADDILAEFPHHNPLHRQILVLQGNANDIPYSGICINAEK